MEERGDGSEGGEGGGRVGVRGRRRGVCSCVRDRGVT